MNDVALEALESFEFGCIACLVTVVARAHQDEIATDDSDLIRVLALRLDRPDRIAARLLWERD